LTHYTSPSGRTAIGYGYGSASSGGGTGVGYASALIYVGGETGDYDVYGNNDITCSVAGTFYFGAPYIRVRIGVSLAIYRANGIISGGQCLYDRISPCNVRCSFTGTRSSACTSSTGTSIPWVEVIRGTSRNTACILLPPPAVTPISEPPMLSCGDVPIL
jgi:hypothetical protein